MSPHPSIYQHTPTGSFYAHTPSGSVPSLNPSPPLGRRRKEAPEGPEVGSSDKKGKRKSKAAAPAQAAEPQGKDPLEIAYGPIVGTNPQVTEDDFGVDLEQGQHRPQTEAVHEPRTTSPKPINHGPGQEDGEGESEPSPTFSIGGDEDEFRNVWDK